MSTDEREYGEKIEKNDVVRVKKVPMRSDKLWDRHFKPSRITNKEDYIVADAWMYCDKLRLTIDGKSGVYNAEDFRIIKKAVIVPPKPKFKTPDAKILRELMEELNQEEPYQYDITSAVISQLGLLEACTGTHYKTALSQVVLKRMQARIQEIADRLDAADARSRESTK
jgi:hypothetical protein